MSLALFSNILSKSLLTGAMIAIDNIPSFVLKFDIKPSKYKDNFNAEYDFTGYPGSRYQYPVFKGCTPHEISFSLRYDLARNSKIGLSTVNSITTEEELVGHKNRLVNLNPIHLDLSAYKGTNTTVNFALKMVKLDYISRVRAVIERFKMPKGVMSSVSQNVAGAYLQVSQGSSNPTPPLILLIRSPNQFYLGYLAEGEIDELEYDKNMICTRIEVNCKFLVTPDLVFSTFMDALREANIYNALLDAL